MNGRVDTSNTTDVVSDELAESTFNSTHNLSNTNLYKDTNSIVNLVGRKDSNASTLSNESVRKMSNDSGISAVSSHYSQGQDSPASSTNTDELVGESRMSMSMQNLLAQQSFAASQFNPALFGMQHGPTAFIPNSGLTSLWSNPLAAAALMQQETARKVLESANGKSTSRPFKQYPKDPLSLPLYPVPGLLPANGLLGNPLADSNAINEALKEQLINSYKTQVLNPKADDPRGGAFKPTRKSHSFSGSCSPALNNSRPSPAGRAGSPNRGQSSHSPHAHTPVNGHCNDDQKTLSPRDDDDARRLTSASAKNNLVASQSIENQGPLSFVGANDKKEGSRKRKNGVIGSSTTDDLPLSDIGCGLATNSPLGPGSLSSIPAAKLSTTSLPANLPSSGRNSARKRARALPEDEKDEVYWERRRKNNEAAKRSRDSRRAKEDEIAIRAAFLERENLNLKIELASVRQELTQLKTELETLKEKNKNSNNKAESPVPASPKDASLS